MTLPDELGKFGIKLLTLAVSAPIFGWGLLQLALTIEKAWKTNDTRKRWIAMSLMYFAVALLFGLLH
jgi:hypothetical protein